MFAIAKVRRANEPAADVEVTVVVVVRAAAAASAPATTQATNMHHAVHDRHKGVAVTVVVTVVAMAAETVAVIHRDRLRGNLTQCVPAWT